MSSAAPQCAQAPVAGPAGPPTAVGGPSTMVGGPFRPAPQAPQKASSGSNGSAQLGHTVCCGIAHTHVRGRARFARSTISILDSARSDNRANTR
ncbi:hypothetical protein GCM10010441_15630 [Kitasatospora paracochleata]